APLPPIEQLVAEIAPLPPIGETVSLPAPLPLTEQLVAEINPVSSDAAQPPTPSLVAETGSVAPLPPSAPQDEAMQIDSEPIVSVGVESGSSSSLKRAGDDLEGREEKRAKEDSTSTQLAPPPLPKVPLAFVPLSYIPPPRTYGGPSTPLTITQHKYLLTSLRALRKRAEASAFNTAVDPILFGIPHYPTIVTKPMDLGTVETKLTVSDPRGPPKDKSKLAKWDFSKGSYQSVAEVTEDVRQTWENTRRFNGPEHAVSQAADKMEALYEKVLEKLPVEPVYTPVAMPSPVAPSPTANARARRPSVSQAPTIRRTSTGPDDTRPKREIHPPPSKDLAYAEGSHQPRKHKRRSDPQLAWANRTLKTWEGSPKTYDILVPFLYPVQEIVNALADYRNLIKRPIDLLIIKQRLNDGEYDDIEQLSADMKLMTTNAMTFNPPTHEVHQAAIQFKQMWEEKLRSVPPKQQARDESEDPLAGDFDDEDESDDDEDTQTIAMFESQIADIQGRLNKLKAKVAKKRAARAAARSKNIKPTKSGSSGRPRKQSTTAVSPNGNGNGHVKKAGRKSYREDEDESEEEEVVTLTMKQDLASRIQHASGEVLNQAIAIIQATTALGSSNEEIELDIDSLPAKTVLKLYNLVCRGLSGGNKRAPRPKVAGAPRRTTNKKASGGVARKSMNEMEEAERIRRMEAQLQSFDQRGSFGNPGAGAPGVNDGGESSSEEESSDEE
ncbi:bromodomain-containing factor 1, partial [Tremellales sp. Uapishka_1]